jgi:hypothetical protein
MLQTRALAVWMQAAARGFVRAAVSKKFPWRTVVTVIRHGLYGAGRRAANETPPRNAFGEGPGLRGRTRAAIASSVTERRTRTVTERRRETSFWRTRGLSRSRGGDLSRNESGSGHLPIAWRLPLHAVNGKQGFSPAAVASDGSMARGVAQVANGRSFRREVWRVLLSPQRGHAANRVLVGRGGVVACDAQPLSSRGGRRSVRDGELAEDPRYVHARGLVADE